MVTVCCATCDWTTDLELTSETNPKHCPRCGGQIVLAANGERSETPLWIGGECNPELFEDEDAGQTITQEIADQAAELIDTLAEESGISIDDTKQQARAGQHGDRAKLAAEILYAWQFDGIVGDLVDRWLSPCDDSDFGTLMDYNGAFEIRPATKSERDASREAAKWDGGAGVILVDEAGAILDATDAGADEARRCYVCEE